MNAIAAFYVRLRDQGIGRALRHRGYTLYSATAWVSLLGMWAQRIGIGWLTWDLTQSGTWLGVMVMAQALPSIVLAPLMGAMADRMDRLKLLQRTQAFVIAITVVLAIITVLGLINIWILLGLVFLAGIAISVGSPARMTIAPNLVPAEDVSAAISFNSLIFTSSIFVGPAVGGQLMEAWGVGAVFVFNVFSYLPHFIVLHRIRLMRSEHQTGEKKRYSDDVLDGLRYVRAHKGIAPVLLMAVVASILVRPLSDLFPGIVGDVFQQGPQQLGWMVASFGVGGMVGSFWLASRNQVTGTARIWLAGLVLLALFIVLLSLTRSYTLALGIALGAGFAQSIYGNSAQVLLQNAVDGHMRARVMSLFSFTLRGGPAIGALIIGAASEKWGFPLPLAVGAVVFGLVLLPIIRRRFRQVVGLEQDRA